jgi:hypothetical protein
VDDSLVVSLLQTHAHVAYATADLFGRERRRKVLQRFSLQVLEDKKWPLIEGRRVFVDRHEMRGAKSREQFGFAEKLIDRKAAFRLPNLDRDEPFHVNVGREKDLGLRSAPEASLDPISVIECFADHSSIALFERTVAVSMNKW